MHADDQAAIEPSAQASVLARRFASLARSASSPNSLFCLTGTPLPTPVPPSACIPVPAPWSDLIVAQVYACVVGQGGGMDGQETETQ